MAELHDELRTFWNEDADTYDRSPSHALTDLVEAAAWRAILLRHLPPPPATVLDAGAGTGAMSLLAAELGYRVTALDLSPGMLARAKEKAVARGLELETVVGPAGEPPAGPFDAVMERHLLWTTPDPGAALRAWREVAPSGRLVVLEGIWARTSLAWRARDAAARTVRPLLGVRHDHHGSYGEELKASLPLMHAESAVPWIDAVQAAGWRNLRIERLRDVEWARRMAQPWPLGWLEGSPHFAIAADA